MINHNAAFTISAVGLAAFLFLNIPVSNAKPAQWTPTESIKKITKAPTLSDEEEAQSEVTLPYESIPSSTPEPEGIIEPAAVTSEPAPGTSSSQNKEKDEDFSVVLKPVTQSTPKPVPGIPAEKALTWLTNGNIRYTKKRFRADGRDAADRKRLLDAQTPHAIVLASTDSRVPPEIIFDQMLGEIVVIRTLGPSLDASVLASIEAALHLPKAPQLLIVLGHTHSEIIGEAMRDEKNYEEISNSDATKQTLSDIRSRLQTVKDKKPSGDLGVEAALNADGLARELAQRSQIVKNKVGSNELTIKAALYRLDSGKVSFY